MIVATGASASAFAAKAATTTIPIVFIAPEDPVRLGLVTALPGRGNVTGINLFIGELTAKRLELSVSWCLQPLGWPCSSIRSMRIAESTLRDVEAAARAMGLQIEFVNASTAERSMRPSQPSRASGPMRFS